MSVSPHRSIVKTIGEGECLVYIVRLCSAAGRFAVSEQLYSTVTVYSLLNM